MSEEIYEGDFDGIPAVGDGSGTEFLEGSLSDPYPVPEDPVPTSNVWAEEFYELDVE